MSIDFLSEFSGLNEEDRDFSIKKKLASLDEKYGQRHAGEKGHISALEKPGGGFRYAFSRLSGNAEIIKGLTYEE